MKRARERIANYHLTLRARTVFFLTFKKMQAILLYWFAVQFNELSLFFKRQQEVPKKWLKVK